jgi:CRISPR-associated endonuclease/helicase Cas3
MDAHAIVEQHQNCTLVVCNTVARAQEMYLQIRDVLHAQKQSTEVLLLHSRFTEEHRRAKQERLEKELGKNCWDGNTYTRGSDLIVVATQVVEVGLDISVRTLHSEIAPANSIIQRAGRCARFAQQNGTVHLYPLANDLKHLPYNAQQSLATLDAFAQFDEQIVDFQREQSVIDSVHGIEDTEMIAAFEHERSLITGKIFKGLGEHDRGIASELIRNVQQSTLIIHPDPNTALAERPWEWETFSLSPYSLQARWEDIQAHSDGEPIIWEAQLLPDVGEPGSRVPARYTWVPIATPARIATALMIVLAPAIASYTLEFGFQLRDSRSALPWPQTAFKSQRRGQAKRSNDFAPYEQESYAEHIRGLLNAFYHSRLQEDTRYIARQLDMLLDLPPGSVHQAIRLAIACHDIGKLSEGWQGWALAWQQKLVRALAQEHYEPHKAPFAHTDYDWKIHRELERGFKPTRPNHAGESAFFAMPFIYAATKNKVLTQAVIAAIARHHNATTQNYSVQRLIPNAKTHITAMLHEAHIAPEAMSAALMPIQSAGEFGNRLMTMPRQEIEVETWLYFVLVRVLRLADGRSFQYKR